MWLEFGLFFLLIAAIPYLIYLFGILFGKKSTAPPRADPLPPISIIISAYNEAHIVEDRITNLALSYPRSLYDVIFVDDCSSDQTSRIAEEAFRKEGISFTIIRNSKRLGTNRSYNLALEISRNEIIISTDANKLFEQDAVILVVSRLLSDSSIAAVCGDQRPCPARYHLRELEGQYRNFYGRMCDWESACDSTFNFNGPLVAFRRSVIPRIEEKRGADDANTAFAAIRSGFRAFYEIRAAVYETVPSQLGRQYRQKIRRATRLLEAIISNLDLVKNDRPFSRFFLPLRTMMFFGTPILFFTGIGLLVGGIIGLLGSVFGIGLALLFLLIAIGHPFTSAFILNQWYLLMGLLHLGRDMKIWESTS